LLYFAHGLHAVLSPFMDSARPACSPQPEVRPLPCQQDLLLELMCKLQYKILEETHLSMPLQTPTCCRRRESMGKTEEKGCCSYRRQEFRQDFDLPEGLNIEDVTCYLDPGGKFHIHASKSVWRRLRELNMKRSSSESVYLSQLTKYNVFQVKLDFSLL
uniref:SHSP domain-containing protein n=1 Tax=Amphilophus citrinellus TaxID=61819 RepID=A0A3Q0SDL1_AMPCI